MNWTESSGVSLAWERSGAGAPLALLHEIGGSMRSFDALSARLSPRLSIIRYDQRGAGCSEKPTTPFTLSDLTDDLDAVLDAAGVNEPVHLLGSAFGAAQAMSYARRHPDRVASLTLLAPAIDTDATRTSFMRERAARARNEGIRAVLDVTLERAWPAPLRSGPAYALYRSHYLANDPLGFASLNEAFTTVDVGPLDFFVRFPVLLGAGRHDVVRPPEKVARIAQAIDGSVMRVFDAPHFIQVHAPDALCAVLNDFFETQAPRRAALAPLKTLNNKTAHPGG